MMDGVSGMLGKKLVYRQLYGEQIVSVRPAKRDVPTPHQQKTKEKFIRGVRYAKAQMKKPEIKALYAQQITRTKTNAYTVALVDFLNPPTVNEIFPYHYDGTLGGYIDIEAVDDFEVVSVTVSIYDDQSILIEEGKAVQQTLHFGRWRYEATVVNPTLIGSKIIATAMDRPGNEARGELVING